MSVILVTHNLGIVAQLADRVAVMYAGEIVETSTAEELIYHPIHPYASALIAAVPVLNSTTETLKTIPGTVPSPENFGTGCRFCDRCSLRESLSEAEQGKCRNESPALREVSPGHHCACHFCDRLFDGRGSE